VVNRMGNRNGNGNGNHSREQGLRLHHLANLGGLIALARLDLEPPDYLLGALLSVAEETRRLTATQRERVASIGRRVLDERATGKRAWKSWLRARELQPLTLSNAQVAAIIAALGGEVPEDPRRLPLALSQALSEASHGTA